MATQEAAHEWGAAVDVNVPSLSRIYDRLLGGGHNFASDRAVAAAITGLAPGYDVFVRESRGFVRRAVLHMLTAGIEQFLDLGAGLGGVRHMHELAQAERPRARVVYVDRDPVAVASLELIIHADDSSTGVIKADLRHVDEVLDHAVTTRLVDLARPVGVVAGSVLHCLSNAEEVAATLAGYHDRLAPGSLLAASHADGIVLGLETAAAVEDYLARAGITLVHRSRREFADLLGPWQPHPDGVAPIGLWRPDGLTLPMRECLWGNAVLAGRRPEPAERA
ncbi:SAM-dependent methyltransferase [Umezawaea sp. Da 62-37]|uniref:SAM-dependent methyltransferase n=1 Tax=Umezawaea sp. Da 62-37 TaxID=3075927 RepID=UPI0028F70495|nr:SAM-dependent methyltransferase [Umezawaea sp. Da 62-37]WNV90261.1 SAM-dependent methyltransferase [Umezawaea sp. Da 62-37]